MPLEVMAEPCNECLMSKNRIVSASRRKQILQETEAKDCHFICHKATIAGRDIACRAHYDATGGGKMGRFAKWLNQVKFVDLNEGRP